MDDEKHTEAIAAAIGAAIGIPFGPAGSIAGAAVAPYLAALGEGLVQKIRARRLEDVHRPLLEAGVAPEELVRRIEEDERLWDYYRAAVDAAMRTASTRKRRALGLRLTQGVLGKDGFDPELELKIIRGVDAVEEHDLNVLQFISALPARSISDPGEDKPREMNAMHATLEELEARFGRDIVDIVVETLENAGLIDPAGLRMWSDPYIWATTRLGLKVLEAFEEAGG